MTLVDVSTGEPLCEQDVVTSSRGGVALFLEACQYAIPTWYPAEDAGTGVTLFAEGYEPVTLTFEVEQNECAEIRRPADQVVDLTPAGGSSGSGGTGGTGGGGAGGSDGGPSPSLDAGGDGA